MERMVSIREITPGDLFVPCPMWRWETAAFVGWDTLEGVSQVVVTLPDGHVWFFDPADQVLVGAD